MKKLLLTGIVAVSFCSASFAQFYIAAGGGYGWPGLIKTGTVKGFQPYLSDNVLEINKVLDPAYADIVDMTDVTRKGSFVDDGSGSGKQKFVDSFSSFKKVKGSYGQGGNFTAGVGYKINKWIAVEIGFNYLWGKEITSTQNIDNFLTLGKNTSIVTKTKSNGLSLMPSVVIYGANKSKFTPYVRLGIALPVYGKTVHDIEVASPEPPALLGYRNLVSNLTVETASTVSVGFQGALGISYEPLKFMNVFAEINGAALTVRAKEAVLTKYTIDAYDIALDKQTHADRIEGTGTLPGLLSAPGYNQPLTNYSKVVEFVDVLDNSSNAQDFGKKRDATKSGQAGYVDESKNHQQQRVTAPLDAFGFNVGVRFLLSKETLGIKKKEKVAN
jgi:hypothetical protein